MLFFLGLLIDKGDVYTWGDGFAGQLGTCRDFQPTPRFVSGLGEHSICQVGAGASFSAALSANGSLFTWGDDRCHQLAGSHSVSQSSKPVKAQLGDDGESVEIVSFACGFGHMAAVSSSGLLYTWGLNLSGQTGHEENERGPSKARRGVRVIPLPDTSSPVKQVVCGPFSTTVLTGMKIRPPLIVPNL